MASGKPRVAKQKRRPKQDGDKTSAFRNPNRIPLGPNAVFKNTSKIPLGPNAVFKNTSRIPLGPKRAKTKKKNQKKENEKIINNVTEVTEPTAAAAAILPSAQQFNFFLNRLQSSKSHRLSSLELESIKDTCILELSQDLDQDAGTLSKHMKTAFGMPWKEVLCEGQLLEGKIDPGSPAVLVISTSALRSLELLRGLRPLTRECRAAKLFAKHMKVEDQVSLLKSRVNLASGTPSRIKKLIDMDALGLSRLAVIVLDMHTDAKGYSLFSLPQVSGEFWDLYKSHFHQRLVQGDLRVCLYGPVSGGTETKSAVLQDE